jgi:hypothetical protein
VDHQRQPRWLPTRRQLLWGVGTVVALAFLITVICGYLFGWEWTGLPKQTLWDWLDLLIVPAALAIGAAWLNRSQSERAAREAAEAQRERERDHDERRRRELTIASLRAQDAAVQAYLSHMSELLMDERLDRRLRNTADKGANNLRVLARARTVTVLGQLEDGGRKRSVLQFLYQADLITWVRHGPTDPTSAVLAATPGPDDPNFIGVIDLSGANLAYAQLRRLFLLQAALGSRLPDPPVYLLYTNLDGAWLGNSILRGADLSHASLSEAHLSYSDLTHVTATGPISGAPT